MPLNVSAREFSAAMKLDVAACWALAAVQACVAQLFASIVPWLVPAMPITSSTRLRVSGQKRSGHRITMPP